MPDMLLICSQCQRQLRVPEEMQGRMVKCPSCGYTFTVEPGVPQVMPAPAGRFRPPEDQQFPDQPFPYPERASQRARGLLMPPAICLLIVGVLGLLANGYAGLMWLTQGNVIAAQMKDLMNRILPNMAAEMPPPEIMAGVFGGFVLCSLMALLAGIQMLRQRTHALAITGSVFAMLILGNACCLLGLPVGIWSLVILLRQDVRSVFQ